MIERFSAYLYGLMNVRKNLRPEIGEGHRGPVFVNNLLVVVLHLVIIVFFLWGGKGALCFGITKSC